MIILEGPDLGGKTTILKLVGEITGKKPFHFISHCGGIPKTKEDMLRHLSEIPDPVNYFYDRHPCISEQIYSFMKGRSPLVPLAYLELIIEAKKPLVLFCYPGHKHLEDNLHHLKVKAWKDDAHIALVRENYWDIVQRYIDYMERLAKKTMVRTVDFRTVTRQEIESYINEYNKLKG